MTSRQAVLVWDMPTRVFHWLLVICFAGAWLSSESERLQMIHYAFGYSSVALVLFRLAWGLVGTRYARFTQFIKGPNAIAHHLKGILKGEEHDGPGHNPAGGMVMLGLMGVILLIGLTGYWSVKEFLGDFMSEAHEAIANLALVLVMVHIVAALLMSVLQKENLVRAMITGKKLGTPEQAIRFPQRLIGAALVLAWVYCFFVIYSGALPSLTQ